MIRPSTETELAEQIANAAGPLCIRGGGTRGIEVPGEVLSTADLSGITLYEPGALTMVARAGTPLSDIKTALAEESQRLAWEPMDTRGLMGTDGAATIGGVVAANVSGPRRIQVGACRDHLLGVRFVDGTGTVIKNGGRVMKNVTGYDLVKLLAGSYGTLGVLSEVSFKVLPEPACTASLALSGLSDSDAVRALSMALGSPFEVTGAAHMPVGPGGAPSTLIRIEGFADSVTYRAERLQGLLAEFGPVVVDRSVETVRHTWQAVRDVEPFHGKDGDIWRISVKPGDGPAVGAALGALDLIYDWGGGLIWARMSPGADVRGVLAGTSGHATLVRCADAAGRARFHPEPAPLAAISDGIRTKFDPRGILNPGLMGRS